MSEERLRKVAVVNAGTSDPSTTAMLAAQIGTRLSELSELQGMSLRLRFIDLRSISQEIMAALVTQHVGPGLRAAMEVLREADGLIVSTPVYKAGPSGLFSSFFQVLDSDLLIGIPVILAGTAGSSRHSLVVDDQLRGLFSYLRAVTAPTGVFAAPEDWSDDGLEGRIDRAASELLTMLKADLRAGLRDQSWKSYQHSYGSAGGTELGIELDSELMRMATGAS